MGKRKIHDWQFHSRSKNSATKGSGQLDLALRSAVYLANAEFRERKKVREAVARDKEAKAVTDELSNKYTDWDLGCMALVLHRKYGKNAEEVAEFLNDVQDLTREFIDSDTNGDDIWNLIREEIGLDITREY